MTVLAVVNQKGGVGKTTTVINVGAYLGALGHRALIVDCDPQANATSGLTRHTIKAGIYDVLINELYAPQSIVAASAHGLDILPATDELSLAELELLDEERPERRLKTALRDLRDAYEHILVDCPPSLGLLTLNALVAADAVLVPVQCEYLALEGLARLMRTLERVRAQSNPGLRIFGLLMTMYDARTTLSAQVTAEVRSHYPNLTFDTVIPRSVRLSEAPSFGMSILDYDPASRGAEAYKSLTMEIVSRLERLHHHDAARTPGVSNI